MIKSDIIFTGFYGQLNTGDDAFVEVASWGAEKIWKKPKNRFLAIEKKLPITIAPVKGYPLTLAKTYDFQKKILLRNADYLISAGGSTIHSKLSLENPKRLALDQKNKGGRIKIGAIGVSVGPFKSIDDEKAVQEYLKNIDFIALRDQRSYDYVSSLETPYKPINAFDLAALLPEIYNYSVSKIKYEKTIGISICPYESLNSNKNAQNEIRRNNQILSLVKQLDKCEDLHFKFFIINGNSKIGDRSLTYRFIQEAGLKSVSVIEYDRNTKAMWEEINRCSVVVSTRLHGAIFACFGKTPFMLVEYHEKCTDFLNDIGYDVESRLFDADFDIQEKSNLILSWCDDATNYKLPVFLDEKVIQSKANFDSFQL